jgi:GDP-mannose 6-dehydrogenase
MVKYASNAFHALKMAFANELGRICKQVEADSHLVMDVFCRDSLLNSSCRYLKPGSAFGGSCLPMDLRALTYYPNKADTSLPFSNPLSYATVGIWNIALTLCWLLVASGLGFLV